jgi:hypothetical protein
MSETDADETSHSVQHEEKEHDPFGSPLQPPLLTLQHSSSIFEDLNNFISIESSRSMDERLDRDLSHSKEAVPPPPKQHNDGGEMAMNALTTQNLHDMEDEMDLLSSSMIRHPLYPHICCYAYKCATEGIIDVSLEEVFQMNEHLFAKVDHERPDGTTVVDEMITRTYQDVKMMLDDMKGFSERVESATKKLLQTSRGGDGDDEREGRDHTKIRGRISKRARDTLRTWILEHQNHPYPTKGILSNFHRFVFRRALIFQTRREARISREDPTDLQPSLWVVRQLTQKVLVRSFPPLISLNPPPRWKN